MPAVTDHRVEAVRQGAHQTGDLGRLQGLPQRRLVGIVTGVQQVVADRLVEQVRLLVT